MARRLPLEAALAFAGNVRRDRFHDPDGVFVVDDHDGSIVDESAVAVPTTGVTDDASHAHAPAAAAPIPAVRARDAQSPYCPPVDALDVLLARARRTNELMRSQVESNTRLLLEHQRNTRALHVRTQDLWRQVERLQTSMRSPRPGDLALRVTT